MSITKLRSGRVIDSSMDELSGLFAKKMKVATHRTPKTKSKMSEDELLSSMFGKISITKKTIGKSRRRTKLGMSKKRQGTRSKNTEMDLSGGRRRRKGM